MTRLMIVAAGLAALSLAACETATPYQPLNARGAEASGGYAERQIEANRFSVTFSGNSLTARETVERYLLYRSAELTINQGYDWFTTVDRHTERDTRTYASDPFYAGWGGSWGPRWGVYRRGYGWGYGYWNDPFWGRPIEIDQVTQYQATAEIVLGKGAKPAADPRAFDAHAVVDHLGASLARPK